MSQLQLVLVSPERTLFSGFAESVSCQTEDGEITILPHHTPLLATLRAGELRVVVDGQVQLFHVGGGFAEVQAGSSVIILADASERVSEIDAERAADALQRAKERLAQESLTDREYAAVASLIERNAARLQITRKHSHRRRSPVTSEGVLEE